jgi:hypothetical protein
LRLLFPETSVKFGIVAPDLTPLLQLPHLRNLKLDSEFESHPGMVDVLRCMPTLRELSCNLTSAELSELCAPPHALPLERLDLAELDIAETEMRSLVHLASSLTELAGCRPSGWPLVAQLVHLRRLGFHWKEQTSLACLRALASSVRSCPEIVHLELHGIDVADATPQQVTFVRLELLRGVPQLQTLYLTEESSDVTSSMLRRLSSLFPALTHLRLHKCCSIPDDAILSLRHQSLRRLEVLWCEDFSLEEEELQALLHSEQLPMLERIRQV